MCNTHVHICISFICSSRCTRWGDIRRKVHATLSGPAYLLLALLCLLRPITKARPPRRSPLPFSLFLFLSFLTRHPSFLHAWHETSLWWSRLETFTAALSIAIESRSLFTFGLNDRARTRALSPLPKLFAIFSSSALRARCRNVFFLRTILNEYRFRDSTLLAFSVSLFFDSRALFACKTKYSPWNVKLDIF